MNGGWGLGWTVELKLNRQKEEKILIPTGGVASPLTPLLDPPLVEKVIFRVETQIGLE